MLKPDIAKGIAKANVGAEFSVEEAGSNEFAYLFLCTADDESRIPNIIALAVNKKTGKIGNSYISFDEATRGCK